MKSNRLMQVILLIMLVIFVAAGAFIYVADSKEKTRYQAKTDEITQQQAILTRGLAQKADKEKEALDLTAQLAAAKASVAQINFKSSAESIEYDRILFAMADTSNVTISSLTASPPSGVKDNNTSYQVVSYTIGLEGATPAKIFQTTADSQSYIDDTVSKFVAFIGALNTSSDFDTAVIESVNVVQPEPMSALNINELQSSIDTIVIAELTEAETQDRTADEIAQLVKDKIAAKSAEQIQVLLEQAGFNKPTAVITIKIWTYKGA